MTIARRQNREALTRLFQGFVNDYGNAAGKKIIKHIVEHAGGIRIHIPGRSHKLNQYATIDNDPLHGCSACFRNLWINICCEFGQASGRAIMNKIVVELGGRKIRFPDHETFYRSERNKKIRNLYDGANCGELALRFNLCMSQIKNIINGDA